MHTVLGSIYLDVFVPFAEIVGEVVGELLQELLGELGVRLQTLHQALGVDAQQFAVGQRPHVTPGDADRVIELDVRSEQVSLACR